MGEDRREVADLDILVGQFLDCTLPKAAWTHRAHLAVGAWHVHRYGPDDALMRLRQGIRALNDSHGTLNSDTSGYHETITRAYVRLIAGLVGAAPDTPIERLVSELVDGPFGEREALLCYYSRPVLMSPRARLEWVAPDVAGLP